MAGPYKKDWLNKLDHRVDATGIKHKDHTIREHIIGHTIEEHFVDYSSYSKRLAALGGL